jgi:hypothetical protein
VQGGQRHPAQGRRPWFLGPWIALSPFESREVPAAFADHLFLLKPDRDDAPGRVDFVKPQAANRPRKVNP